MLASMVMVPMGLVLFLPHPLSAAVFLSAVPVLLVDMELVPSLVATLVVLFLVLSLVDTLLLLSQELLLLELLQQKQVPQLPDVSIALASLFLAVNKIFKNSN